MDVNGTRFHLLLGEPDWAACLDAEMPPLVLHRDASPPHGTKLRWSTERQELTLEKRLFNFVSAKNDRAPQLADRRGAARDSFGNWYWISEAGDELLVNSSGTGRTSHFWSAKDVVGCEAAGGGGEFRVCGVTPVAKPLRFGGLAVTAEHYLVAGVVEPAGLLIFDLHAGSPPQQLCWPQAVRFVPFDMAAAPGGGVFILDRENRRYWTLDRRFNVLGSATGERSAADDFQPVDGGDVRRTPSCAFPPAISEDAASLIAEGEPIAIEALPDSTILILFSAMDEKERFSAIRRYGPGGQLGEARSTRGVQDLIEGTPESFRFIGHDFAFVPSEASRKDYKLGTLYVVGTNGNQSFAFDIYESDGGNLEFRASRAYLPLRLFGGKALVAAGEDVYYDFGDRFIPLVKQMRPRYEFDAVLYTPLNASIEDPSSPPQNANTRGPFDGREPDCVWHRLLLDGCIPPETSVEIYSRAANDQRDLKIATWEREPRLQLRSNGSELPFVADTTDAARGTGTWELLFQKARGRYLQLQIRLSGNGRSTPRLRALRVYYPRFSYLAQYLPGVYREDADSASFLDRFLANLEGFYTTIEDRIAAVQALLDSRGAPSEALDWLAGWFDVALDPSWDDARRRLFIRNAMKFFQWRGTMRGLETALRLALDACADESLFGTEGTKRKLRPSGIRIIEKYRTRLAPGVVFGDPTDTGADDSARATRWLAAQTGAAWGGGAWSQKAIFKQMPGGCRCQQKASPQASAGGAVANDEAADVLAAERVRWQEFLKRRYEGKVTELNDAYELSGALGWQRFEDIRLPDDLPQQRAAQADWLEWVEVVAPSESALARKMWQGFIAHRYRSVRALNVAYGTRWTKFSVVSLPDGTPRAVIAPDWNQFVGITLRMRRTAHAFTVMLPISKTYYTDIAKQREQRSLAERIVNLEKPAHTVFDVKFYWTMFSIGRARLGDVPLDQGSRAPQLMPAMTLGQQFLAESYLAPSHPQTVAGRQIVGRDAVRRRDAQTQRLTPIG